VEEVVEDINFDIEDEISSSRINEKIGRQGKRIDKTN
jgi:hypothetical protein